MNNRNIACMFFLLLFIGIGNDAFAQNFTLQGIVLDNENQPLPGAMIVSENEKSGTMTDSEGVFNIPVEIGDILKFSYIGFSDLSIRVENDNFLKVIMQPDISVLDDVVVIGYGTQTKKELTSAISSVKGEELNKVVGTSISTSLKGKTTGMRIYNTSGAPGSQATITIRGGSSINKSNSALIIVDGVEMPLSSVNPQDVASIEVLKDAASTAIYGSRASNGIVLITTKTGREGKLSVNANISYGYQNSYTRMDKMDAVDYLRLVRPALARSPYSEQLTSSHPAGTGNDVASSFSTRYLKHGESLPDNFKWIYDPLYPEDPSKVLIFNDNDLQDEVFQGGSIINAHLSLNGGTDKAKYMVSLGYVGDDSFTPNRDWNSVTLRTNVTYNLAKKLRLVTNISGQHIKSHPYAGEAKIFSTGIHLAPTIKVKMNDGTYSPGKDVGYQNPLYYAYKYHNERNDLRLSTKLGLEWDIINDLTAKLEGYYTAYAGNRELFEEKNEYNTLRPTSFYGDFDQTYQLDFTVNYKKTFAENHNFSAMAGFSGRYWNIYTNSATAQGGTRDDVMTANVASEFMNISSSREEELMNSYFARLSYNYKSKYMVTFTVRADGSSKFYRNNRWAAFPGVSVGYLITEEDFMKNAAWLSNLKIRASFGQTGNNSVGRYDYQGIWSGGSTYLGETSYSPSDMPNYSLRWEKSDQVDVGLDIGFLQDRISMTLDYYNKVTNGLLFNVKMPNTSGFGSVDQNIGSVRFWGYEASINAVIINTKDFVWDFNANISYNMNKVLKLPYNGNRNNQIGGLVFNDDQEWNVGGTYENGRMYGVIGYKVAGILDTQEAADAAMYDERAGGYDPLTGTSKKGRKFAGDYEWVDKNGDGKITSKDQYVLGYLVPTTTGGFSTTLTFKNVELYASFDYALGHVIYDRQVSLVNAGMQQGYLTPTTDMLDSWKQPGDAATVKYARYDVGDGESTGQWNHYRTSEMNLYKGDYLSFRELKISYDFSKMVRKWMSGLKIYASGQNLYCFSEYPGYITEYSSSSRNLSDGNFPLPRVFTLGINLTF